MTRRILLVSSQVRSVHSGVGTYAAMILRGLQLAAGDVRISVATWDSEVDESRGADGSHEIDWIRLGPLPQRDPTPGRFWTLGRRLVDAFGGRDPVAAFDFDVVHFLDAREGHAFVKSALAASVETIGTVHDDYAARVNWNPLYYRGSASDPYRRFVFHRWLRRLEQRCYPQFDLLMINSDATGAMVQDAYGLDPRAMAPVTLTVDPTPVPAASALQGEPSLVFCGGNFYRKGLDVCVTALPALRARFPGIRLHVVGSCGSLPQIQELVDSLDVAAAVEFHGQVPPQQAAAMIGGADLFVMPSRTEALGLVYLEAFRAGVPVIAGNRGGVVEIVRDGESGLLVPAEAPTAFAAAVARLVDDNELREHVIDGGRRVLAERTPDRLMRETVLAYGLPLPEPAALCTAP